MRNYWKQSVVLVTRLKADPLISARLRLTVLFTLAILLIFGVFNFVFSRNDLEVGKILILIPCVLIISYLVGGSALSPIRQLVRAQRRFIADASHELRTPLAIMKTNSEVGLMGAPGSTSLEEALGILRENLDEIDRMSKIIEHLLSLSFYENKFIEIPSTKVDLAEIVKAIVGKTKSLAVKKNVILEIIEAQPAYMMGNHTALEQLAMNIIKNAIVYTPSGGKVMVSVKRDNHHIEMRVQDTGIGIAPEDLPNIFNPFYRAVEAKKIGETSGLGLAIVQKIVARYHGTINVKSKLHEGTRVTVTLRAI